MNIELTRVMELNTVNNTERGNKSEAYWSMQFSRRRKGKKVNRMKTRGL